MAGEGKEGAVRGLRSIEKELSNLSALYPSVLAASCEELSKPASVKLVLQCVCITVGRTPQPIIHV